MNVVILTTEVPHHTYFVRELLKHFKISQVFIETDQNTPPFDTEHLFEDERDKYEKLLWFGGKDLKLEEITNVNAFKSLNNDDSVGRISRCQPDIIIVFGTSRLRKEVVDILPNAIYNLHGGDPQQYRGLDSHLWAIYHRDFGGLETTLHQLNGDLDDGAIVAKKSLHITKGMKLHELRRANTEVCIELVTEALNVFSKTGRIDSQAQTKKGRYYSFMPTVLKEVCVRRFSAYTGKLT